MSHREIRYIQNLSWDIEDLVEFGSGYSTGYWVKTFKHVTSIETRIEWFKKMETLLNKEKNLDLIFCPPESCAFGFKGEELWNTRNPSDYGTVAEFRKYLSLASEIIESRLKPNVIFIDANVRPEIIEIAINAKLTHEILVHDVIPERAYLNHWIEQLKEKFVIIDSIDGLVHIRRATVR